MNWETVREFLKTLPGAEPDPSGGRKVVRVRGKVVALPVRNARGWPADDEFVVVKVDRAEREALLHKDPETFFVTPHYETYPGVIIRLSTVQPDQLRELLIEVWRLVAPKRMVRELKETAPGEFVLNEAAGALLDEARSLISDLIGIGDRYARIWGLPLYRHSDRPFRLLQDLRSAALEGPGRPSGFMIGGKE
jgi:hypothetical protein